MKPLQQLFYILKFQILIYPYRFMGILLFCCMMTYQQIFHKNHGSWADIAGNDMVFCLVVYILSLAFLQREVHLSEDQRFDSAPGPMSFYNGWYRYIPTGSSFFWTRALGRNLIQLSDIMLYAVFVIILLLPGITLIGQSMEPLQIFFQSPEDNGAFQRALLADPHLGAYQFYDYAKRIIIEIPHGWDYQIGLWLFQALFLSLFVLWISKGMNVPERLRHMILANLITVMFPGGWLFLPLYAMVLLWLFLVQKNIAPPSSLRPLSHWLIWSIIIVTLLGTIQILMLSFPSFNLFLERYLPPDPTFYGDRFMLYAKYHLWLWIGLALAAIFLIQSIIRKHLRPA